MLVHGWKSLAPSLPVRGPRSPLLGLFAAGTLLACSEAEYQVVAPAPECELSSQAELRQYAIYEYQWPTKREDLLTGTMEPLAEDMDGDGKADNQFGDYFAYGPFPGTVIGLPSGSLPDLSNRQTRQGRGTLLLDVWASAAHSGCARLNLRRAAAERAASTIRLDGGSTLRDEPGGLVTSLRASGTQDHAATVPYSKMTAAEARVLDLYIPLVTSTHLIRLYGARVTARQIGDQELTGTIHGVLRLQDVDEAVPPVWARELTTLARPFLSIPEVRMRMAALENTEYGKKKCALLSTECCHTLQPGCTIYPEELRQYFANGYAPDLDAFDASGAWQLTPHASGGAAERLDSLSVAVGFRAVRIRHEASCPPGRFCTLPGPEGLRSEERITAGWAARSSDLWVVTDAGRAFHYDGISWVEGPEELNQEGSTFVGTSMWGSHSDDIWAGMNQSSDRSQAILRHWDGGHWRPVALDAGLPADAAVYAIHGTAADDVWAAVSYSGETGSNSAVVHFDGSRWQVSYGAAPKTVTALYSPKRGELWAAGYDYLWLQFRAGAWSDTTSVSGIGTNVLALTGTGAGDVWAVTGGGMGTFGSCAHFDGQTWLPRSVATCEVQGQGYRTAWTDTQGVLWTGGEKGLLRRYDPTRDPGFVDIPHDAGQANLKTLFGVPEEGAVWAITSEGKLLRYQP